MSYRRPSFAVETLEGRTLLASVPAGFTEELVATGLEKPTAMQFAPDGRLFVAEQGGALKVITAGGALLSTPFVTVPTVAYSERGLLGVAFDPDFESNQHVYVYYTASTPNTHNRLSRFTANGNVAVPGSETILLELDPLSAGNHNGGAINFGADGKLYVAVGENNRPIEAQSLSNLHGKMLRLNRDGTIPTDNPFYNQTTGNNRAIWALGLRNPFSFGVQPGTGKMFINDVGQQSWEEINLGAAGANYGWPGTEGPTNDASYESPLFAYPHYIGSTFNGAAIAGAAFYNPQTVAFPSHNVGDFFFTDYVAGYVRRLDLGGSAPTVQEFATGLASPIALAVGDNGSLYYLERGNGGRVVRVNYAPSQPPSVTTQPQSQTVTSGKPVTFTVGASGPGTLSYRWTRNNVTIPNATGSSYTINATSTSDNNAVFRAFVTNAFGTTGSNAATLTVTSNTAPIGTITSPAAGTIYNGGQTFSFNGRATDSQDGALRASRFAWRVDLHHDSHTHPFVATRTGVTSGTFTIPNTGHTETNVFYRITLTVTDSGGLTHTTTRDLQPRKVNLSLQTSVPGLSLALDGQPIKSPVTQQAVSGMLRQLGAPETQTLNGVTYRFTGWSDGGAATHNITMPTANTTYTATYAAATSGLHATYYNNPDFTGTSASRLDAAVNFDWDRGAPMAPIAADTFSVRWTGQVTPQYSQTYTFYTQSDDRVRLWVNNRLLIDLSTDGPVRERSATIALTAGVAYPIRVDYVENTGHAVMRLLWSSSSQSKQAVPSSRLTPSVLRPSGLQATYYDNADFTGKSITRLDSTVNFNWGYNSPAPDIGGDTFAVRWVGKIVAPTSQTYTFHTQADDRVRLWINGKLLIDLWTNGSVRERSATIALAAGIENDIRIDYMESTGHAIMRLLWSSPTMSKQTVPTSALIPLV
ncbi:MAG TPA: PQQ-dependent sugar dehydrogenase [Tepidisphaeraceae bacterium]|jgi:glucose/arabinose dehydrogenase|nr:PQQ-dependent sugar dehydrogenase [Tepidisphaeraceae bacterium]